MYVYQPQFKKKKEKLLAWFLVALGLVLYIASQYPGAPVPGLIQILGVCCLAGSILIVSMYILRSYSYELVEGEDGRIDFVITEHYSRRKTVKLLRVTYSPDFFIIAFCSVSRGNIYFSEFITYFLQKRN